jgi:hypothetical protein
MNETFEPNKIKPKRKFIKLILLIISYAVVAGVVWIYSSKMQQSPTYQQEQAQKQVKTLVEKVGKLVVLPESETPQVAVIQDVDSLKKTQEFFIDAQNGDRILVYPKARKAFIYRESSNKIINVALNIGADNTPQATTQAKPVVEPTTEKATTTTDTDN